ncbi:MAG TPA: high frequency lysogenization protein HflD [Burkholderiales bacterium]
MEQQSSHHDRILALAGIFQAARLVQQLSREGRAEPQAFAASLRSVLAIDAPSTAEVYGGAGGVALGLTLVRDKLGGSAAPQDLEMAKYVIAMLQLEAALRRRPEVAQAIRAGLRTIQTQMEFFESPEDDDEAVHPRLPEKLAELYTRTLSTLNPRIMVTGEQGHLANAQIAASVRAALFAGIRSAVLWRQLGGSRWQLLVSRPRLAAEAARRLEALRA